MSLFDYKIPQLHHKLQVLVWAIDQYGFVQVEKIHLEI